MTRIAACKRIVAVAAVAALAVAVPLHAQGNPPGTVTVSAAVHAMQQGSTSLDGGGSARWHALTFSAGLARQIVPAFAAGMSLRYDDQAWTVRSANALGPSAPWRHLLRYGVSANASLALNARCS